MRKIGIVSIFLLILFCEENLTAQVITTIGGTGSAGYNGDGISALTANIGPSGVGQIDKHGNCFLSGGYTNDRIRMIDTAGIIHNIAGTGSSGYNGDGIQALSAQLNLPTGTAVDSYGNIYIADYGNSRIRKIDATTGIISTIAGNGTPSSTGDGGLASASTVMPMSICLDAFGNIYFSDSFTRVRKINALGIVSTVAGNGIGGFSGDGGLAINASLAIDLGICTDMQNNVYVSCAQRIRKIDIGTGLISTVAGNGVAAYNGDEIPALSAQFSPRGIDIDELGNLFISDYGNNRIRKVDLLGIIHTVAGNGTSGFSGDGGLATMAQLNHTEDIALDSCGNLYISDAFNYRIRKVSFNPNCWPLNVNTTEAMSFNIHPNPAQTQLTITTNNVVKEMIITNALGQQVHSQKANKEKTVVDVSSFAGGVYFVTVSDESGAKVTKKIILNHD